MCPRVFRCIAAFLFYASVATPQTDNDLLNRVWSRLELQSFGPSIGMPVQLSIGIEASVEANAYCDLGTGRILVTTTLLEVIGSSEGELAFVVAHEAGHAIGEYRGVHRQITSELAWRDQNTLVGALNRLFETDGQALNRYQHPREIFADTVAVHALALTGYNPFDAGAWFGRMQMLEGTTDPWTRALLPYASTHPFHEDRIESLRGRLPQVLQIYRQANSQHLAREAEMIGVLRRIIAAEQTYASATGGTFGTLACLAAPTVCIPGYPAAAPAFLEGELALEGERNGYQTTFYPGPPAPDGQLTSFAYVAIPIDSTLRAFCVDASGDYGRICELASPARQENFPLGRCPATCAPLK